MNTLLNLTSEAIANTGSELAFYAFKETARFSGGLAVSALAVPCIRNGAILAGTAHTMRHFSGPFLGFATLLGEAAILYATGSDPISSIAMGVIMYYSPKGIEVFAQKAISKVGFLALDLTGRAAWYLTSKGVKLAALGACSAYKGMHTLLWPNQSSQKTAPAIATDTQDLQAQPKIEDVIDKMNKLPAADSAPDAQESPQRKITTRKTTITTRKTTKNSDPTVDVARSDDKASPQRRITRQTTRQTKK